MPVICARITYLGELGYELYVPAARALELYDAMAADARVRPVGLKALASLRMEKAYRDFGHDIDNTDCPLDVGLGFAVAWDTDFRGKAALLARKASFPSTQRLVQIALDRSRAVAVPRRAGAPGRRGRSATSAPRRTAGRSAPPSGWPSSSADETVTKDWLDAGAWEVDIAGDRYAADRLAAADVRPDQRPGPRLTAPAGRAPCDVVPLATPAPPCGHSWHFSGVATPEKCRDPR